MLFIDLSQDFLAEFGLLFSGSLCLAHGGLTPLFKLHDESGLASEFACPKTHSATQLINFHLHRVARARIGSARSGSAGHRCAALSLTSSSRRGLLSPCLRDKSSIQTLQFRQILKLMKLHAIVIR